MPDTKVEDEVSAGTLDGTEELYVVKAGAPRKTTTGEVAAFNSIVNVVPAARLSLTDGVAVTKADVSGAVSIFYVAAGHANVHLYDPVAGRWNAYGFGEPVLLLDSDAGHTGYHQASKNFRLFLYALDGAVTLCSGPAWAADTPPADVGIIDGVPVNSGAMVLRYGTGAGDTVLAAASSARCIGAFRALADGQAVDSKIKRWLYNAFNKEFRPLKKADVTASWTYSTATYRQARADTSNQVSVLTCFDGTAIMLDAHGVVSNSTTTLRQVANGIGVNSTTVNSASLYDYINVPDVALNTHAEYNELIDGGYTAFNWLEKGAGTDTQTWFGAPGSSDFITGLSGGVWM